MNFNIVFIIVVILYTVTAVASDVRGRRIPNCLTLTTAILGFIYHGFAPQGAGILFAMAGFTIGFGLLFLPWLFGGEGMGDIKLLAALGAWLGTMGMFVVFSASVALLLGGTGLAWWMDHFDAPGRPRQQFRSNDGRAAAAVRTRRSYVLPYAVAVTVSTWALLAWNAAAQVL